MILCTFPVDLTLYYSRSVSESLGSFIHEVLIEKGKSQRERAKDRLSRTEK